MRREVVDEVKIKKRVHEISPEIYSKAMTDQMTDLVLSVLVESYLEGRSVNFGLGRTFLKLRNCNANFSPSKLQAVVFRGVVRNEKSDELIKRVKEDSELKEILSKDG